MKKLLVLLFFLPITVSAASSIVKVDMLETWRAGNIAFTLDPAVSECNAQFFIDANDVGLQNMYSAILTAKISKKTIRVVYEDVCGGYGNGYNRSIYVYLLDE